MWAAVAATLAAIFPVHAPGPSPLAFGGPSGRVAVGGWHYRADAGDTGLAAGWANGGFGGALVQVPHVGNPVGTGAPSNAAFRGSVGWYTTAIRTQRAVYTLRFDRASFNADVWIDGRRLGSHTGSFDPFELTTPLAAGSHRLVVRVDWRSPARQSAAGYHRTWFNYGGLDGEVTLRRLAASAVTGAAIRTTLGGADGRGRAAAARVAVDVRVLNRSATRSIAAIGRLREDGHAYWFTTNARILRPDEAGTLHATVTVPHPDLWSPGHGARYELDVGVRGESALRSRVGLRNVGQAHGRLLVNGVPVVMRGASMHEDSPAHGDALTPAEMDTEIAHLRAIGANTVRAQHALAAPLLERLDGAGILVWEQIGPVDSPGQWLATTPALQAVARGRVDHALRAARLHPSVVIWGLGVEVAGNGAPGQGAWVDAQARELHAADPGRLVGVDVWGPHRPASAGLLYAHVDVVGVTSYFGWYEDTFARPAAIATALRDRIGAYAKTFPGKLLVLTEFGAEGTPAGENPPASRGGTGYQASLLGTQLQALKGQPIGGAFVWLLDDFAINPGFTGGTVNRLDPALQLTRGLNQKGLFDRFGHPKPAVAVVRAGLAALGG